MLVGIDPEVFVRNKATGAIVPAIGLVGGTKTSPRAINNGGFVQEDNVMAEFNIEPAPTFELFEESIQSALFDLDAILNETGHEYDKTFTTTHTFDAEQLDHPQAVLSGCDPDFNLYRNRKNPTIDLRKLKGNRMCAGHIHCGLERPDKRPETRALLVHWMDVLVGAPLSMLDPDTYRKQYYGRAGNYRPKPYGIEYRTPSNFWLGLAELREWVFETTQTAIAQADSGQSPARVDSLFGPDALRSLIDDNKMTHDLARHIFRVTTGSIPSMFNISQKKNAKPSNTRRS